MGNYPDPLPYWSARKMAEYGLNHPLDCSERVAIDCLDILLCKSVRQMMVADVPLALLEGLV